MFQHAFYHRFALTAGARTASFGAMATPPQTPGAFVAVIDRLAPVLVPQGTLWAQYVAAVAFR